MSSGLRVSPAPPTLVDSFGGLLILPRADIQTNLFLNPPNTGSNGPDNTEWMLGTSQQLRWKTNITNYNLMLYQQLVCSDNNCVNGPFIIKKNLNNDTSSFVWTVTTSSMSLTPTNNFILIVRDADNELNQFGSSYLNFTTGVTTPTNTAPSSKSTSATVVVTSTLSSSVSTATSQAGTTSLSSSSSTSITSPATRPTASSVSIPNQTSVSTPTPTALPISSLSGLSSGAKVGMVIGVTSAVILAIIAGWYLGRKKLKWKKSPIHPSFSPPPPVQLSELYVPEWSQQKMIAPPFTPRELKRNGQFDNFAGVRELDASHRVVELGAGRSRMKSLINELGPPRYT